MYHAHVWSNSSLLGNCVKDYILSILPVFYVGMLSFLLDAHISNKKKAQGLINWYRKLQKATTVLCSGNLDCMGNLLLVRLTTRSDLNHWWDLIELHESSTACVDHYHQENSAHDRPLRGACTMGKGFRYCSWINHPFLQRLK